MLPDPVEEIRRKPWDKPFHVPSGTNYADAIQRMITDRYPAGVEFRFPEVKYTTPHLIFGHPNSECPPDPWQDIQDMACAIGHRIYFKDWVCVMEQLPDLGFDEPTWTFLKDLPGWDDEEGAA